MAVDNVLLLSTEEDPEIQHDIHGSRHTVVGTRPAFQGHSDGSGTKLFEANSVLCFFRELKSEAGLTDNLRPPSPAPISCSNAGVFGKKKKKQ